MPVTRDDLKGCKWKYTAHYNMGRAGYGYGFCCEQHPRLSIIEKTYKPARGWPNGKAEREWYVDGALVGAHGNGDKDAHEAAIAAAIEALAKPPTITADEHRILLQIPDDFVPLRKLEDDLAGVPRPSGGIRTETPHSLVLSWLHSLQSKGLTEYGRNPERGDGKPWNDLVPEHMRWSPTIRRRPNTDFTLAGEQT